MAETVSPDPTRVKLESLLSDFYVAGWVPGDDGLGTALLKALRHSGSTVPAGAEAEWAELIEAAYEEFCWDKSLTQVAAAEDL